MLRICLCLLIAVASAGVAAREVKLGSPNDASCPDTASEKVTGERVGARTAPARPGKAKPSMHSDAPGPGRLQSPRWHSFLPGMFR